MQQQKKRSGLLKNHRRFLCLFAVTAMSSVILPHDVVAQSPQSAAAASEIRFQQLEKEIRRLTGQIEEQNYEIRRLRDELSRIKGDVDVRFNDLERGNGAVTSGTDLTQGDMIDNTPKYGAQDQTQFVQHDDNGSLPAVGDVQNDTTQTLGTLQQGADGVVHSTSGSVSQAYDRAYSYIKNRDFENAEQAFEQFMKQYPNDDLIENAKYWYAETFYVRGSYDRAARVFAEGYRAYPKGTKAPSNLLKLGMSLAGMGKVEDSCVAFAQLKKEYKNASMPVLKRADTEMKRAGCRAG